MRVFLVVVLAALGALPGVAGAQDAWTHVACVYTWVILDNGVRRESAESSVYRFNTEQIDRWVPESSTWTPECDAARNGFTEAACSITDTVVSAVRKAVQDGETVRFDTFSINRMTAVFTARFEFRFGTGGNARGSCRVTDDPSAGLQRQF